MGMKSRLGFLILLLFYLTSCQRNQSGNQPVQEAGIDPELLRQAAMEKNRTPHDLFRRINIPFAQAVCNIFEDEVGNMPSVILHGDAHLEQYTVTDHSAGLADFDDAAIGPAILDLIRFGSSIYITCEMQGWTKRREEILNAFLGSYQDALANPELDSTVPKAAERLRTEQLNDRRTFLEWATSLIEPLEPDQESEVRQGIERYIQQMYRRENDFAPGFFEIKTLGRHDLGLGSARTNKVLARIEGPTTSEEDDVILEGKELRDLSVIECVYAPRGDALRVVLAQLRMGKRNDPFLAVVPRGPNESPEDMPFWVQSWTESYSEIRIEESFQNPEEMIELVRDVGIHLAQGHTALANPFDFVLREVQELICTRQNSSVLEAVETLSNQIIAAWDESQH